MDREILERAHQLLRVLWVLAALAVVVGSLLPPSSAAIRALSGISDKAIHFLAYFVLGILPALHERMLTAALMIVASIGLGVALEFGQRTFSGRSFEMADMVADGCGALSGLLLGLLLRRMWKLNPVG